MATTEQWQEVERPAFPGRYHSWVLDEPLVGIFAGRRGPEEGENSSEYATFETHDERGVVEVGLTAVLRDFFGQDAPAESVIAPGTKVRITWTGNAGQVKLFRVERAG